MCVDMSVSYRMVIRLSYTIFSEYIHHLIDHRFLLRNLRHFIAIITQENGFKWIFPGRWLEGHHFPRVLVLFLLSDLFSLLCRLVT